MPTLDLDGMNVALPDGTVFTTSYLTGSDDVTNSGLLDATLTEGGGPAGNTYSGVIYDGAHATTAITQTSGVVTFTSASAYSGGTNLEGGTIGIANASALGTGVLTMASGTTLEAAAGSLSFANTIQLIGAGTIDTNGYDFTLSDTLTGSGPLTITDTGSGALVLNSQFAANTYSGNIFLDAGTLELAGIEYSDVSVSMGSGTLTVVGGAALGGVSLEVGYYTPAFSKFVSQWAFVNLTNDIVLDGAVTVSAYGSLSGMISGAGSLTVMGIGGFPYDVTLDLTENDTYSGGTTIGARAILNVSGSIVGNVLNNGTLIFDNPQGLSFGGQISGGIVEVTYYTLTFSGASNSNWIIESTLVAANQRALATGTATVLNGGILQAGISNLTVGATIVTNSGGTVEANTSGWTITLSSGQTLTNNGTLEAIGGDLVVDDAVTGTGTGLIANGGTLAFSANFQQAVTFSGGIGAGTLALSQLYNAAISGFAVDDAIDFTSLAYKSSYQVVWIPNGNGGMVAIDDTATNTVVDSVTLNGTYNPASFRLSMDSQGGTEIIGAAPPTYDFNGNGKSDVLFQNSGSGQVYEWLMNGTTVTSSGFVGNNTNPGWEVVTGAGDYNGDGNSDILWQNVSTGQVYEYEMNGTSVVASNFVGNNTDPTWQAVGTGDFSGDGYSDILFQNSTSGQVFEWEMNGFSVIGSGFVGDNTSPSWQVVGIGDFNGDGKSDILFQNVNTGQVDEWEMNGTSVIASGVIGNNTDPTWKVVGTGDFNGNGNSDILFQNVTTGQVYEWEMNGLSVVGSSFVGNNTNPAWRVVGTGDYSGNGSADILFENSTTGQMYEWLMNGTTVVSGSVVGNNTSPTWHAVAKS